ncbi:MAG: hypothetical protein ACO3XP_07330 [Ilumatobacteraceae bacterium]
MTFSDTYVNMTVLQARLLPENSASPGTKSVALLTSVSSIGLLIACYGQRRCPRRGVSGVALPPWAPATVLSLMRPLFGSMDLTVAKTMTESICSAARDHGQERREKSSPTSHEVFVTTMSSISMAFPF